jgi:Lysine-specific metallo-endopeptidase
MDSFTEAYTKARSVVLGQKYQAEWQNFLTQEVKIANLLGVDGPDPQYAAGLDQLRWKILKEPAGKRAECIVAASDACERIPGPGSISDRAATLKLLWHFYRAQRRGGQDVWVYSPPKAYGTWVYSEISGGEASFRPKLALTEEVYTWSDRDVMTDALCQALASAQKAVAKLGSPDANTTALVRRWFADESTTDEQMRAAIQTLLAGFKKISAVLNSNQLVFSDEPLDRNKGGWKDWAFVRPTEKMDVVYIQGAFLKAGGSTGRMWICVETIVHEVSHRAVGTDDNSYDYAGLKPAKSTFPFDKALNNADTWGYFCIDLAGMLSDSDRTRVLKSPT